MSVSKLTPAASSLTLPPSRSVGCANRAASRRALSTGPSTPGDTMPAVSAPHPEAPLLTALELAERTGTDPALIERLIGLSILTPGEEERAFGAGDFQRVRFAVALERAGISLERVGQAIADGHLSFAFMDLQWGHVWGRLAGGSYREICDSFGLPVDLVLRVHAGIGLPPVGPDDQIREDDTEVLPAIASMRAVGMDEATILRVTRVYGENI